MVPPSVVVKDGMGGRRLARLFSRSAATERLVNAIFVVIISELFQLSPCPCSKIYSWGDGSPMKHEADDFARSNRTIWQCQDRSTLCGCSARLIERISRKSKPDFHAGPGACCRQDGSLGGAAFVAMMQSSDLGERDDLARSRLLYWPGVQTILVEREMRPDLAIILEI